LIKKYGDGTSIKEDGTRWEQKWFLKYQYYKEIGKEIDRRVKDGKSVERIIKRLEFIRMQIKGLKSVKRLVEGIRIVRGEEPFGESRGKVVDIKALLEEDY
jgi:hypothetical protein